MIIEFPLTKSNRIRLARAYKFVPRVDMSIECVIEAQMGKAFVDDTENPTVFKIQIGPFFYFAGDAHSEQAAFFLENIEPYTLFMPSKPGWINAAKDMHQERLIGFDRFSFTGERISIEHLDKLIKQSKMKNQVKRMNLSFANRIWDQGHFVDLSDFDSPKDFADRGLGFYVEKGNEVIGAAYSSLVCSKGIEVSLYVMETHRRLGVATVLSSHLVKWSIENKMKANWDAANQASCKLAEKLGYQKIGNYQAHYLQE